MKIKIKKRMMLPSKVWLNPGDICEFNKGLANDLILNGIAIPYFDDVVEDIESEPVLEKEEKFKNLVTKEYKNEGPKKSKVKGTFLDS